MKGYTRKFEGWAVYEWWDAERKNGGSCTVEDTKDKADRGKRWQLWNVYTEKEGAEREADYLNENCGNGGPRWGVKKVQIATVK